MAEFKLGRIKFVYQGTWAPSTAYVVDDVVTVGGKSYICTTSNTSSALFSTDLTSNYWSVVSDGSKWTGTWAASTYYNVGDQALYGGIVYICKTAHTSATYTSPTYLGLENDQSKWDAFAANFNWLSAWAVNTRYKVRDLVSYNGYTYVCNASHISAATTSLGLENDQSKWDTFNAGISYQGIWSGSSVRYKLNDIVTYGANLYICTTQHTSTGTTLDATKFSLFVTGFEFKNSWNSTTNYILGDMVTYGGYTYTAVQSNIGQTPSTATSYWQPFTTGFNYRSAYNSANSYRTGDVVQLGGYTYLALTDNSITTVGIIGTTISSDGTRPNQVSLASVSVSTASASGGTATLNFTTTQPNAPFVVGQTIVVSGFVQTAFNGTFTVTGTPSTSQVQYALTGTYSGLTGTVSGTTAGLTAGMPITFSGTTFGGIVSGTVYYIYATPPDSTHFVLASSLANVGVTAFTLTSTAAGITSGATNPTPPVAGVWSRLNSGIRWYDNQRTYSALSATNVSSSGTSATFNVTARGTTYSVTVQATGSGYAGSDTLKILGTNLGGVSPANDLSITVSTVSSGAIATISISGISTTWYSGISYVAGDAVFYGASSYICVLAHASSSGNNPAADTSATYWNLLASGTEQAVLTTTGDMFYYGNSGATRLPIGTNGQVLRVNNSLPSWQYYGQINNIVYVSTTGTDTLTNGQGTTVDTPWKTIRYACQQVEAGYLNTNAGSLLTVNKQFMLKEVNNYVQNQYSVNVTGTATTTITVGGSSTSSQVVTSNLFQGMPISFSTSSGNIVAGTTYYVAQVLTSTTFNIALTYANATAGSPSLFSVGTGSANIGTYAYDATKTERDTGFIIEGVIFDLTHNGTLKTTANVQTYFNSTGSALISGVNTYDIIPFVAALNYLKNTLFTSVLANSAPTNNYQALNGISVGSRAIQNTTSGYTAEALTPTISQNLVTLLTGALSLGNTTQLPIAITPATSVMVKTGTYNEILPIIVPAYTAIVGDELRSAVVQPATAVLNLVNDKPKSVASLQRISAVLPNLLTNATVTATTGNTQSQVTTLPTGDTGSQTAVNTVLTDVALIEDMIYNGAQQAPTTFTIPSLTGYNTVFLVGFGDGVTQIKNNYNFIKSEIANYLSVNYNAIWTSTAFTTGGYQAETLRDIGFVLDGLQYDMTYGCNNQSIINGSSYYSLNINQITSTYLASTLAALQRVSAIISQIVTATSVTASATSAPYTATQSTSGTAGSAAAAAFAAARIQDVIYWIQNGTANSSTASVTGSIGASSTTMTVTAVTSGVLVPGMLITGTGVTTPTYLVNQLTGVTAVASPTYSSGGAGGTNTFVVGSATGIVAGQFVTGTNIPAGSYVISTYTSGTTITLVNYFGYPNNFVSSPSGTINFYTAGGTGTYTVSVSQTVSSTTLTGNATITPVASGAYALVSSTALQTAYTQVVARNNEIASDAQVFVTKFYQAYPISQTLSNRDAGLISSGLAWDILFSSNFNAITIGRAFNRSNASAQALLANSIQELVATVGAINLIAYKVKAIAASGSVIRAQTIINDAVQTIYGQKVTTLTTATTSTNLLTVTSTTNMVVGMPISFTGLPANITTTVSSTTASTNLINLPATAASLGIVAGQQIYFTGTVAYPIVPNQMYYVINPSASTIQISLTAGGSAVALANVTPASTMNAIINNAGGLWNNNVYYIASVPSTTTLTISTSFNGSAYTIQNTVSSMTATATAGISNSTGSVSSFATTCGSLTYDNTRTTIQGIEVLRANTNFLAYEASAYTAATYGGTYYQSSNTTTASGTSSTISGLTLTIGGSVTGTFVVGMVLTGNGVTPGTFITALGTGTGGAGNYTISTAQSVNSATAITGTSNLFSTVSAHNLSVGDPVQFTSTTASTTITGTNTNGNITVRSTTGILVNMQVIISGGSISTLTSGTYYVLSASGTTVTLSTTYNGSLFTPGATAIGSLSASFGGIFGGASTLTPYYVLSTPSTTSVILSPIQSGQGTQSVLTAVAGNGNATLTYYYNIASCLRDTTSFVNALIYDIQYPGNYKMMRAVELYNNAVSGSTAKNMYQVRNGTGLRNMTLNGITGTLGSANSFGTKRPTGGAYSSLDPGFGPNDSNSWISTRSCYTQNCTMFGYAAVGAKVDGALHNGGNRSMVANDYTTILGDGIGYWVTGSNALAELVSVFNYYGYSGYLSELGGKIRATNGNSSYGTYGVLAEGVDTFETPIYANLNNRYNQALITNVVTDATSQILRLEYSNAGSNYTNSVPTISGSGYNAQASQDEYRDAALFETRLIDLNDSKGVGGSSYISTANTGQSNASIIGGPIGQFVIANTDTALTGAYVGMRIQLTAGTGVGQYANILTYANGSKTANIVKDSIAPLIITAAATTNNLFTVASTANLYAGMPVLVYTAFSTLLTTSTVYYVNSANFSSTQFQLSLTGGGSGTAVTVGSNIASVTISVTATAITNNLLTATATTVTVNSSSGSTITLSASASLTIGAPISFASAVGTAGASTTYYVQASSGTSLSISLTPGGTALSIGTTTGLTVTATVSVLAAGNAITFNSAFNGVDASTVYYIVAANLSPTTFSISTTPFTTTAVTITATGSVSITGTVGTAMFAAGWDHTVPQVIANTNLANTTDLTTTYIIEPRISYSSPGYTSTARSLIGTATWSAVTYGAQRYAAIASGSTTTSYSVDGKTWSAGGVLPASTTWQSLVYGGGQNARATAVVGGFGGQGAVLTAIVGTGGSATQIVGITVVNGGYNYTTAPTIVITGGGGSGATATCTVLNGVIQSVTMTINGSSYSSTPTVTAVTSALTSVTVNAWGRNYPGSPQITIDQPQGLTPSAFALNTSVSLNAYIQTTAGRIYQVTQAGTTDASVTPAFDYTSTTYTNVTNGTAKLTYIATQAQVSSTITNGGVSAIALTVNGYGYSAVPAVTILDTTAVYLAVANNSSTGTQIAYNTASGLNSAWTAITGTTIAVLNLRSVAYGNGLYVAVGGASGTATAASSSSPTNSANWISRSISALSAGYYSSICYGATGATTGTFMAVNNGGLVTSWSNNAVSWTQGASLPSGFTSAIAVAYGNGRFVVLGSDGKLAYSINNGGTASPAVAGWTAVPNSTGTTTSVLSSSYTWSGLTYGQGLFFAIASGTAVCATSPDGINWTVRAMPSSSAWTSITFGNVLSSTIGAQPLFVGISATSGTIAASIRTGATTLGRMKATGGIVTELRVLEPGSGYPKGNVTATTVSTNLITADDTTNLSTSLANNQPIEFTGLDSVGLVTNTTYYVIGSSVTSTQFSVTASAGSTTTVTLSTGTSSTAVYRAGPIPTQIDPNRVNTAALRVRMGDGALGNPSFVNRGTNNATATATTLGDGFSDVYQNSAYINVSGLFSIPQAGANVQFATITGTSQWYKLVAITNQLGSAGNYTAQFQVNPALTTLLAPAHNTLITTRLKYSQVRLTGHDFLYIGTGNQTQTNYPYVNAATAIQANQTYPNGGGRVFFTSTDQDGNFNVGNLFGVQQSTGTATLNASAFNLAGLQSLTLGAVTLGIGSATITQFSTDPYFTANSDNILPTQKAIKSYITAQIGGGQSVLNVNTITAGQIYIAGNTISNTNGTQIYVGSKMYFAGGGGAGITPGGGGVDGAPVALWYFGQK